MAILGSLGLLHAVGSRTRIKPRAEVEMMRTGQVGLCETGAEWRQGWQAAGAPGGPARGEGMQGQVMVSAVAAGLLCARLSAGWGAGVCVG